MQLDVGNEPYLSKQQPNAYLLAIWYIGDK